MIEKLKRNFDSGIEKLKWFSGLLNERMKVEIAYFKLAGKAEKLRLEKEEFARMIGEKVFEGRHQLSVVVRDEEVKGFLKEMELVDEELKGLAETASKVGKET